MATLNREWLILFGGAAVLAAAASMAIRFVRRENLADLSHGTIPSTLAIKSANFADGAKMPKGLTCDGDNLSPDVEIPRAPPHTKSLALVMDDLDAPFGFVHWLVYDISPTVSQISEGASSKAQYPLKLTQGTNGFGNAHYDGPCPPSGLHRYRLSLYAVDISPNLPPGETRTSLSAAISGHIIARGQIIGLYNRATP